MSYEFKKARYMDNKGNPTGVAIFLYDSEGLLGRLTTNLDEEGINSEYEGYLDVNNAKNYMYVLDGRYEILEGIQSGYVVYPRVRFNKDFIDRLEEYEGY